jgi:hypothetical protein
MIVAAERCDEAAASATATSLVARGTPSKRGCQRDALASRIHSRQRSHSCSRRHALVHPPSGERAAGEPLTGAQQALLDLDVRRSGVCIPWLPVMEATVLAHCFIQGFIPEE